MDTDTSDAWLESGKYRSARNLRYLTDNGENTGELHSIEGYEDLSIHFADIGIDVCRILASTTIRDKGVFVLLDNNDSWFVCTIDKDNLSYPTLVFGPCSTTIGNNF